MSVSRLGPDPRSVLFAPGDDERKVAKAMASEADLVVLDLEDGVLGENKDAARSIVARTLTGRPRRAVAIRIDAGAEADLALAVRVRPDAIVVPKARPNLRETLNPVAGIPLVALVETAAGLTGLAEIAAWPAVVALALGNLDLSAELGLERRADGLELLFARSRLVLASACAGLARPVDGVYPDVRDAPGFEAEALLARSLGFGGKLCIHPVQVDLANRNFAPSSEQLAWAERVLAAAGKAAARGTAVFLLDNEMVDEPVLERARAILRRAKRIG